jgi:hypothetical protein
MEMILVFVCELVPKVYPHLSVTLCVLYKLIDF